MSQPPVDKNDTQLDDLQALRSLLFKREIEKIAWLESQAARYPTTEAIARALPEAVRMSSERSGRLKEALAQPVESALQKSVAENPQPLVDVLFPILGPIIRRAVRSALDGMLQGLNQATEHSLNPVSRYRAWRAGMPLAEYVVLKTLVYRVEQLFLLERETSLVLRHATNDPKSEDPDMVAGMLSALQEATRQFAVDSFNAGESETLDVFQMGELEIHLIVGRQAVLAAVVRGTLPSEIKVSLTEFLESVEFRYAYQLETFQGDAEIFSPLAPEMNQLLIQEREAVSSRPSPAALALLGTIVGLFALAFGFYQLTEYQWSLFIKNLEKQPGILVTRVETPWWPRFSPLGLRERQVYGLKDHLADDPKVKAEELGFLQPRVRFFWEPFQSDHPYLLRQRAKSLLSPPASVKMHLNEAGLMTVQGRAPKDWIERARLQATLVPGIERYDDSALEDVEPINRIKKRLAPPDSVELMLSDGDLLAVGKATHQWIEESKVKAAKNPEVKSYDITGVTDLDLQRFQILVKNIGERSVYFVTGSSQPSGDIESLLDETVADWGKLLKDAKTVGKNPILEVTGQSDKLGTKAQNEKLSLERAAKIRDLLVAKGVDPSQTALKAVQSPNEDPRLRRVIFLVSEK